MSVLTPVFNQEKFVAQTIESILGQKFTNWELLIVDDSSTDSSWDIIQKYVGQDTRIRSFRNGVNSGLTYNWRFLIDRVRGEYISFLEGDDVFAPGNLGQKINVFEKHGRVAMVYNNFSVIDAQGDILTTHVYNKYQIKTYKNSCIRAADYLYSRYLLFYSFSQIMIRRSVIDQVGYPRSLSRSSKVFVPSDWDFNFRVATTNKIYYIDESLLKLRKHADNSSANTIRTTRQMQLVLDEYAKEFHGDDEVLRAIDYMRAKLYYYNVIYYIDQGNRQLAVTEFNAYVRESGLNLWRDWQLNLVLAVRIFLPKRISSYLKNMRWRYG